MALYLVLKVGRDMYNNEVCMIEGFHDDLWERYKEYFNLRKLGPTFDRCRRRNVDGTYDSPSDVWYGIKLVKALNFLADNGYRVVSLMCSSPDVVMLERKQ
ncbi:uncharacterized protein LOC130667899 [Microplitis mediator]|uniref:uncharacterized protein LOC130667899 n=1 Tax=Microplitis mediator TaxID=375433 RepID=UPI0025549DC8|nr:uncharacterized protein LOC130667899 [Microplitis mediator]XP_057325805.1 uncharacterized protein LOC130667899 [Microplitis mediator]XP_057325806.1 uncharacterized protein LOC130667899 [Microplitis mediator]XP_057325807.1 uncharacterized protein LOC130667899 [Microplitis mediator]